jgi:hypothetical protein
MKFVIVDPFAVKAELHDEPSFTAALAAAQLKSGEIDFGALSPSIHIVVWEYSFYAPIEKQRYFAINKSLFAGHALLFQVDDKRDTVDFDQPIPPVRFFRDAAAVEMAIANNEVMRPEVAINDEVFWQWNKEEKK